MLEDIFLRIGSQWAWSGCNLGGSVSGFHTLFDNVIRLGGRVGLWPVSSRCFEFLLTKPGDVTSLRRLFARQLGF
jgi:hypothetical protein